MVDTPCDMMERTTASPPLISGIVFSPTAVATICFHVFLAVPTFRIMTSCRSSSSSPQKMPPWRHGGINSRNQSVALRRDAGFHGGDVILHRLLNLLESAHFDLSHPLARDAELVGEFFQRDGIVRQPARLEDAPLALIEHGERLAERLMAIVRFLAFDQPRLLAGAVIDQPILPLARVAIFADRRVERHVATEAAVHVDHVLLGDTEAFCDELNLVGAKIALFERGNLALGLTEIEEELLLVRGRAHFHERPGPQDVFLDRRLDPPHRVGGKPETLVWLNTLDRLDQPDIAFRDDL